MCGAPVSLIARLIENAEAAEATKRSMEYSNELGSSGLFHARLYVVARAIVPATFPREYQMSCTKTWFIAGFVAVLAACSSTEHSTPVGPPPGGPISDTVSFPDPTGSANRGLVHFNLTRNSTSNVPSSADSALVHIYNYGSSFNQLYPVKIPVPGAQTVVSAQVPADTGYYVAVLAFHGSTLDAVGSSRDNSDTTITVFPEGNPTYVATQVHIEMSRAPFATGNSAQEGEHVAAGSHIPWSAGISAPFDIFTDVSSTWGCQFNGNVCAVYSYQGTVPDTPGPWALQEMWIADYGDHVFSVASDTVHVIIDQGTGGIDISFSRQHQPQH